MAGPRFLEPFLILRAKVSYPFRFIGQHHPLSLSLSRTNICPLVLIRARKTNSPQPRISRFSTRNLARHLHSPSTRLDVARTRRGGSVVESRAIKTSGNIPPICGVSETQRSMRRSDTGKAFPLFNSSPLLLDFEKHSSILARCKRRLIYAGRASITFFPPSLPFPSVRIPFEASTLQEDTCGRRRRFHVVAVSREARTINQRNLLPRFAVGGAIFYAA